MSNGFEMPYNTCMPPASESQPRTRRKRRAVIATLAVTPLAVVGIAYAIGAWRAHVALEKQIRELVARGEPVWFSDLAVPVDDPSLRAGNALAAALDRLVRPSAELIEFTQDGAIRVRPPGANVDALLAELEASRPALRTLIEMSRQGECRFSHDFLTRAPPATELPRIDKINDAMRFLAYDAWFAIDAGDQDRALWDIMALVDLGETLRHEPFSITQLVRIRCAERALDMLELLLSRGALPMGKITEIGASFAARETDLRLAPSVRSERAALLTTIANIGSPEMRETLASMAVFSPGGNDRMLVPDASWKSWWWGSSLYAPRRAHEQAVMLQRMSEAAAIIDEPGALASLQLAAIDRSFGSRQASLPITSLLSPSFLPLRDAALEHRQRLLSARVALTVFRHRAEDSALPATLEEIPGMNPPTGLFSGEPLIFQNSRDGFAVYDVSPLDGKPRGRFAVMFRE